MASPYEGLSIPEWEKRTRELIAEHPLDPNEIHKVVLHVWDSIFASQIGSKPFQIGVDIFPRPQIMAFLLHELIALEFGFRYPNEWRGDEMASEKDLVYIPNEGYSIEIKTSSSIRSIFGNRSYAQGTSLVKKIKSGYYLAINFEKFGVVKRPKLTLVRFGWLDHSDWIGQTASTGQQARLNPDAARHKLLRLPLNE